MTCKPTYSFFLYCDPMPTPRPRATTRGGKFASIYHDRSYTSWKEALTENVRGVESYPGDVLAGPLTVSVRVQMERPRTSKLTHPKPDCDNLVKGLLDAITQSERFWRDDSQVVDLRVVKAWADPEGPIGYHVDITA
jgi:Holliday junction resolvase RusA-like endonuclease